MKLKSLYETIQIADQVRALTEGATNNPLLTTLRDFAGCLGTEVDWVLMGGLAVGFRAQPRGTQDVDIVLLSDAQIDEVAVLCAGRFTRHRKHALEHRETGVEVELLTPEFLGLNPELVQTIIDNATEEKLGELGEGTIRVASADGLIAAKLPRANRQDLADIEAIIRKQGPVDLSAYPLTAEQKATHEAIEKEFSDK